MIQNAEAIPTRLSGVRKSAILMIILGEQASTEILREMEEDEVQAIGREIARMSDLTIASRMTEKASSPTLSSGIT